MNNYKKILRVFLFIILFIPAYLAVYNIYMISSDKFTVENISKIEVWAGIDGQAQLRKTFTESGDIKKYLATLNNASSVSSEDAKNQHLDDERSLVFRFYKGDITYDYRMYLPQSLHANECFILTHDEKLKRVKENDALKILETDLSDSFYYPNRLPAATLIYSDGLSVGDISPKEGEWYLKKPDGKYYLSTIENRTANSNSVNAYQTRPFEIFFGVDADTPSGVEPDQVWIRVMDGKEQAFDGPFSDFNGNFSRDEVRDLQYILTAEWWEDEKKDGRNFSGKATYVLDVKYFVPPKFDISQTRATQGGIVAFTAYNVSQDEKLTLTTDSGSEIAFVSVGTNKIALIPVANDFAERTLNLTLTSDVNEPRNYEITIDEREKKEINMGAQEHNVDPHLGASAKSARQAKYDEIFAASSETGEQNYWADKFEMPRNGDIALGYGWDLSINSGNKHKNNGIFIDTEEGSPVKASNSGKVIFVGEVPYDGNLVVIDHGMGIKTWYGHLDIIQVKVGDGVLKGQDIATSGTTGMKTTLMQNLYFAVSVGNVFVDPEAVIKDGIPGIDSIIAN